MKDKEQTLSNKIYSLDKHNKIFHFDRHDKIILRVENVKQSIRTIKTKWREKARKMKIMSGEVAIFEFEQICNEEIGKKLI